MRKIILLLSLVVIALTASAKTWRIDYLGDMPSKKSSSRFLASLPSSGADVSDDIAQADKSPGLIRINKIARTTIPKLDGKLIAGDEISLAMFSDVEVTLKIVEEMPACLGARSYICDVIGSLGGCSATILERNGNVEIDIQDISNSRIYHIFHDGEFIVIEEIDETKLDMGECEIQPVSDETLTDETSAAPKSPKKMLSAGASTSNDDTVDLLVVFDRGAAQWVKNRGGITNFAEKAVQKANQALRNNGLTSTFKFRLVDVMKVEDVKNDLNVALSFAIKGGGEWNKVKSRRELCGADIVCTLIDTGSSGGTTGLGRTIVDAHRSDIVANFAHQAFNACAVRAVYSSHTMTHEIGHNMGAQHSDAQDDDNRPSRETTPYAHGYYLEDEKKHTIMAYWKKNSSATVEYEGIPYFSSPNSYWNGTAVGTAALNDNARTIREMSPYVKSFMPRRVGDFCEITFSPEDGTLFSDTLTVTLTPEIADMPVHYTTDGSEPTVNSPLYTSPITISARTTIKAVAALAGVAALPYSASYGKIDLSEGVDASDYTWSTDAATPWSYQISETHDGEDAVQSYNGTIGNRTDGTCGGSSSLKVQLNANEGDKLSFWYATVKYSSPFKVTSSASTQVLFEDSDNYSSPTWKLAEIELPKGNQTITFSFTLRGYYYARFNGVYLDQVMLNALSKPPTILPATTETLEGATTFTGQQTITLQNNSGSRGKIYYTIDGTDPEPTEGNRYTRPFTITETRLIKAMCVETGKEQSKVVSGYFEERHSVQPGEWTTDAPGAVDASKDNNGRMIIGLGSNTISPCGESFDKIINDRRFLAWAKANRVYLISADSTKFAVTTRARAYFNAAYTALDRSGSYEVPGLVIMDGQNNPITFATAREGYSIGNRTYDGTAQSLVRCLSGLLGADVPSEPTTTSANLVSSFPVTYALANPNSSGVLYYTTDGTPPTPENGKLYTGPVTLTGPDQVLTAAVWDSSGWSSPCIVMSPKVVADVMQTDAVVWSTGGEASWREDPEGAERTICSGELSANGTSWVEMRVSGGGTFKFNLNAVSYSSQNRIKLLKNGAQIWSHGYNYTDGTNKATNINESVSTSGTTVYRVEYAVSNSDYNFDVCGAWLSNVEWLPPSSANEYPVPETWFKFVGLGARTSTAAYTSLGNEDSDGDGYLNWQEYVLGTDPLDNNDKLICYINFDEYGLPVISWNKTNNLARVEYKVQGSVILSNSEEDWHDACDEDLFFRVKVINK